MKILFIGGTGIISTACSRLAVARGHELYLLNRGATTKRPAPAGAHLLRGDIRDRASARTALKDHRFDVVVEWIAFTPEHIESSLKIAERAPTPACPAAWEPPLLFMFRGERSSWYLICGSPGQDSIPRL